MLTRTHKTMTAVIEHVLFLDVETLSALDMPQVGVSRYVTHRSTQIRCVCYAADAGPVKLWLPGDKVPAEVRRAASQSGWIVVAHNAGFERSILEQILTPRHGWPEIDL